MVLALLYLPNRPCVRVSLGEVGVDYMVAKFSDNNGG